MADEKRRLVSLTVVGGPLDGQQCLPDEVVGELLIGCDPGCQFVLELPGISPIHARLWTELDAVTVRDAHAPRGVYVNDARVETDTPLGEGDLIWLGPPGEAESVCLKPAFGPWVEVLPFAPSDDPFFVGEEPAPKAAAAAAAPEAEPPAPVATAHAPLPTAIAADSEPIMLVEDDLAALAGGVAAEEPLLEATEVAPEPEVDPLDDFFVAEEPTSAEPADAAHPPAKPVQVVLPPAPALAAAVPAPAVAAAAVPPAPVSAPAAPVARAPVAPASTAPKPVASPPPKAAPAMTPAAAVAAAPAPPMRRAELSPDRTAPHLGAAATSAQPSLRRQPAAAASRPHGRPPVHGGPARGWVRPLVIGLGGLALAALGVAGWRLWAGTVRLDAITPARVRVGQHATLTGGGFAPDLNGNVVLFDGERAKVLAASPERLEVEVPVPASATVGERRASVLVRARGRASATVEVTLLQGPRLHGLSPAAALPGEEVTLVGSGWGPGATVRFGAAPAEIVDSGADRLRVRVPADAGGPGTLAPVVVTVGGVESNAAPFVIGHPPVVTSLSPETAAPGELVRVTGVGFEPNPLLDDVRVGGVPALVVSASPDSLGVVVPRVGPGEASRALEVRLAGSANVGSARLGVPPPPSPPGLRFVAEPFTALAGRPHAVVASGVGPVFVLAASGGRAAAQRALEAQQRLNAAVDALRTTLGLSLEARGYEARPVIGLTGRAEALLEVTDEDAAAYNEDWTRLRGRGGPVTPGRLARWWEALGRDLVLLELRGERPRHAAALAPEGRALVQLFELAQRSGRPAGAPEVIAEAKPPLREALRLLALRVPAGVTAPAAAVAVAAPVAREPPRLQLEGSWRGSELEEGLRRYLTVTFSAGGGSISYEGGLTLTMPLKSVEPQGRSGVRFAVPIRGGVRYYSGKWDGEKLAGSIATDSDGREVVASFELRR